MVVPFKNDHSSVCWEARFSFPATKNEQGQFRDKSD